MLVHKATTTAKPAASTPPKPAVTWGPAFGTADVGVGVAAASASFTPRLVLVVTTPLIVVVTRAEPVVVALHPDQVVHGADDAQLPDVHPGQVGGGQAPVEFEYHHFVHEPVVHGPFP